VSTPQGGSLPMRSPCPGEGWSGLSRDVHLGHLTRLGVLVPCPFCAVSAPSPGPSLRVALAIGAVKPFRWSSAPPGPTRALPLCCSVRDEARKSFRPASKRVSTPRDAPSCRSELL